MYPGSLLHVEDDDAAAVLLRLALDEVGFTGSVYRVTDGEQALLFLRKSDPYGNTRTPQLVVLDLNLPSGMVGLFWAEKQCDPVLKHISFVVLSTASAYQH